ncbi:MAG: hypothetical protein JW741_04295 [Sedimentisphaerales bacterium]|nr:hypothetical protein [Sedimentisphaerales bacterium]
MNTFPKPPFHLGSEDGDAILWSYLSTPGTFSFFSTETRGRLESIEITDGANLGAMRKDLLDIWPRLLTDALLELKMRDPREAESKDDEKIRTFFDEASLGVAELRDVLEGFSGFESLMYGASPDRYRDHIVHSFRVWIIGHGILKECLNGCLHIDPSLEREISPTEWECMWAIAALCHDIGYPLSQIEKVNERARTALQNQGLLPQGDLRFTFSQQMQPFHDTMIRLMASSPVRLTREPAAHGECAGSTPGSVHAGGSNDQSRKKERRYVVHLQNKYYLKLLKSFDELHHGIVSALLISKALVYFLESDFCHDGWAPLTGEDARQMLIRREILRAIADHTCQDVYHLRFDKLSFLLYMADEIQCWGRPTLTSLQEEPAEIMDGSADVRAFGAKRVSISISTQWQPEDDDKIIRWIGKLRRMLRLAVGTRKLKELSLTFRAENSNGEPCVLELRDGSLHGPEIVRQNSI